MFDIHLNRIALHYSGCPRNGLAAVDWRRANGLPDLPSSVAVEKFDPPVFADEALCRAFAKHLDDDADLAVDDQTAFLSPADIAVLGEWEAMEKASKEPTAPFAPAVRNALMALLTSLYRLG